MTTSDGKGGEAVTKRRAWKLGERCAHGQLGRQCEVCQRDDEIAELRAQVEGLMERVKCEAAEVDKGRDVGSVLNHWIPAIEQEFGGTQGTDAQPHTARLLMAMRQWNASRPATDAARLAAKGEK